MKVRLFDNTDTGKSFKFTSVKFFIDIGAAAFNNIGTGTLEKTCKRQLHHGIGGQKSVVFLGSVNDATADDLRAEAEELGIHVAGFLPESRFDKMPAIGPDTVLAPIQPYLSRVAVKLERERGARVLHSLFPFGPDGSRVFWEDLAREFGITVDLRDREKAAWEKIRTQTALLKGKKVFLTADTMMELPLARFLKSAGADVVECSSA